MTYCMCSFLRVTRVCPPTGPPGTVLSAETLGSVHNPTTSCLAPVSLRQPGQLFPWNLLEF